MMSHPASAALGTAVSSDDDEDADCCMPELPGCDICVSDLGCEADDDDEAAAEAEARRRRMAAPRRLSLQQRRRLNLYSKPVGLPALNLMVPQQKQQQKKAKKTPANQQPGSEAWTNRDTPTIHEEDSGLGSVASPDVPDDDELLAKRGRSVSGPLDADAGTDAATAADGAARRPGIAARLRTLSHSPSASSGATTSRWPKALNLVFQNLNNDMWRELPVSKMPEETAIRHRYNALKRQWMQDTVQVKIEPDPFNRGAMRECFRLKKLSTFSKFDNWHSTACNYVAKSYLETVDPSVYFEDVRVQMNAKLWAQEYNRHHPPKKVDIMQMCVIEFKDREGGPLYHLEHHIEGKEYGDGNLGVRGIPLFFSTHVCNEICRRLGLSRFDMAPSEITVPPSPMQNENTCVRGDMFAIGSSPMPPPPSIAPMDSGCSSSNDEGGGGGDSSSGGGGGGSRFRRRRTTSGDEMTAEEEMAALSAALKRRERPSCVQGNLQQLAAPRCECDSGASAGDVSGGLGSGSEVDGFGGIGGQPLPGMPEVRCRGPILGRIHHELARLHDAGRLVAMATNDDADEGEEPGAGGSGQLDALIDWPAAVFHERLAADLGVVEAAVNLARLHLGLPTDCLQAAPEEAIRPSAVEGHACMETAARLGDRSAMLYLARAHDTGDTTGLAMDWDRAAHFYQRALATSGQSDREGGYDSLDTPGYLLRARLAQLYLQGGHGLEADPSASSECFSEAAEEAMAEGNGKLAAKYYALAEEASALVPEDD